jgi:hypothetical protein
MNKDKLNAFVEEMVQEVKDLKDLTKEELPLIAKEYIAYLKFITMLQLIVYSLIMFSAVATGLYAAFGTFEKYDDLRMGLGFYTFIAGIVSFGGLAFTVESLTSLILQPKRTAIYAITSLLD